MPFQNLLDMLAKKQNESNDMIGSQVDLMRKKMKDNSYQPSLDEAANENKYYDSVTGAVAGSLAPEVPESSLIQKEKQTAEALNNVYNQAAKSAEKGVVSEGADALAVAKAQAERNRALDMANRYRDQVAKRKSFGLLASKLK